MSESIFSLVRIKLHFIETTLWSSMLIHSFGMFMWQTAAVWLHLCSLRFKIHRRPLLIWESRFLLFLVPHPFLAVCGKSFTCVLFVALSLGKWRFFPHQGLRRKQPLCTFSISCFILFIYLFIFYWIEETLGRYNLGFPGGGRDKRSTYRREGRKVRHSGCSHLSHLLCPCLTHIFGSPSCVAFLSKKDMEFHRSPI